MKDRLTSTKPFMFNGYYDWMLQNEIIPYLLVDAEIKGVQVPLNYVKEGHIVLSLNPNAIVGYEAQERGIFFKARFNGNSEDLFIPYKAMEQLFDSQSGQGIPIGLVLEQLELGVEPEDDETNEEPLFELDFDKDEESRPSVESSDDNQGPSFEFVKDDE